jgi:uncharacterized membrane protein
MAAAGLSLFLIDVFDISFSTIYLILISGFIGYFAFMIKKLRKGGKEE